MQNKTTFIGRLVELERLRARAPATAGSVLTAIYGRRRVGKSRLVEEACQGQKLLKFEGLEDPDTESARPEKEQREHFLATLYRYSGLEEHRVAKTENWIDLFLLLSRYLGESPSVVLFDEFQWMAGESGDIVSRLKYVWDNFFLPQNKCNLILCGSV